MRPGRAYIGGMKRILLTTATSFALILPAAAQEAGEDDGITLMERGAQMFFEGIMREMEPALEDLQGLADDLQPTLRKFVDEMGPAFADVLSKIDDFSNYHPPEILPNGDIIIRRKSPEEILENKDGEVDT